MSAQQFSLHGRHAPTDNLTVAARQAIPGAATLVRGSSGALLDIVKALHREQNDGMQRCSSELGIGHPQHQAVGRAFMQEARSFLAVGSPYC